MEYSEEQTEAINSIDGQVCIISVAGSGKTAVIVARADNIVRHGVKPYRILVLTFSKAAAAHMQERYIQMYGDNGIRFSTIHSLCYSVLVRAYGLKPESVLSDKDRFKFLTEFHNQLMYKRVAGVPEDLDEFCRKCDEYISEEARNEYYENTKKYIDTHKNAACNTSQYFKMICRNEYEVNGYSCNNNNSCMNYSNADNGYDSKGVYDNKKNSDSPMSVQSAAYENGGTSNTSATYKSDTTSRNKAYLKLVYEQYKKYKLSNKKLDFDDMIIYCH